MASGRTTGWRRRNIRKLVNVNTYKVIDTTDGGKTLFSDVYRASYHSIHGAIEESLKVFIELGLQFVSANKKDKVKVFEMGFGSGLNALLSFQYASLNGFEIEYHGVEAHPLPQETIRELNYASLFAAPWNSNYQLLHSESWGQMHEMTDCGKWIKYPVKIQEFNHDQHFNLIYFDAFAPDCQPELWTEEIFTKMYSLLADGGVLTTYCAKGSFKRTLKSVGFKVESHPGPARKREITRALKI